MHCLYVSAYSWRDLTSFRWSSEVLPSNLFGTNERHDIFVLGKLGSAYLRHQMKYCGSVLKLEIWGNAWSFAWTFLELISLRPFYFLYYTTLLFCLEASGNGLISLPVSCRSHQISWITFLLLTSLKFSSFSKMFSVIAQLSFCSIFEHTSSLTSWSQKGILTICTSCKTL